MRNEQGSVNQFMLGLSNIYNSPALLQIVQSLNYLGIAAISLVHNNLLTSIIFLLFVVGSSSAARLSHVNHLGPTTNNQYVAFRYLPNNLKVFFFTPGIFFSVGNVALILSTMDYNQLLISNSALTLFTLGFIFIGAASICGIAPLLSNNNASENGVSSLLCGIGDIILGLLSLVYGNYYIGLASIFWGYSIILSGLATQTRLKRIA